MAEQEDTKLPSSHEHIKNISTHKTILTENKLETGIKTITQPRLQERFTQSHIGKEQKPSDWDLQTQQGTQEMENYMGSELLPGE